MHENPPWVNNQSRYKYDPENIRKEKGKERISTKEERIQTAGLNEGKGSPGQSWDQHPNQAHSCKTQLGGSKTSVATKTQACKTMTEVHRGHTHSCKTILGVAMSIFQRGPFLHNYSWKEPGSPIASGSGIFLSAV